MIVLSEKEKAFSSLSHQMKLHIKLTKSATDDERLLNAIEYNEPSLVKFYLEAGVSANSTQASGTSPIFHAVFYKNPLIIKMLLNYGANPNFEHNWTHRTVIEAVFTSYAELMISPIARSLIPEQRHKLVMIAAMIKNIGLQFDTPNSKNKSPLDTFGLIVGRQRKEQVLTEFLAQINQANIDSIRPEDVIARVPEDITRLSVEEEQKVALFLEGRYAEVLNARNNFDLDTISLIFSRRALQSSVRPYNPPASIVDQTTTNVEEDEEVETLIEGERYLNSAHIYHSITGQHLRIPVSSREAVGCLASNVVNL